MIATFNPSFDARIIDDFNNIINLTINPEENITVNSLGNISVFVPISSDNYPNGLYTFTLETKPMNSENWVSTGQSVSVFGLISLLTTPNSKIEESESFTLDVTFNPILDVRIIDDFDNITNLTINPGNNVTLLSPGNITVSFQTNSDSPRVSTYKLQIKPTNSNIWVTTRQSVTIVVWRNLLTISSSFVEQGYVFTITANFNPLLNTRIIDNLNNIIDLNIDQSETGSVIIEIQTNSTNYPSGSYNFTLEYKETNSSNWVTTAFSVSVFVFSVTITALNKYNEPTQYVNMNEDFFIDFTFSPSDPPNVAARIITDFSVISVLYRI